MIVSRQFGFFGNDVRLVYAFVGDLPLKGKRLNKSDVSGSIGTLFKSKRVLYLLLRLFVARIERNIASRNDSIGRGHLHKHTDLNIPNLTLLSSYCPLTVS
jgi:hypothetical protein